MSEKCTECGRKLKGDETECPSCGKALYTSVFGNISAEIEAELADVTADDLRKISGEGGEKKMDFEEFSAYFRQNIKSPPPWIMLKARLRYENWLLPKMYDNYLKNGLTQP